MDNTKAAKLPEIAAQTVYTKAWNVSGDCANDRLCTCMLPPCTRSWSRIGPLLVLRSRIPDAVIVSTERCAPLSASKSLVALGAMMRKQYHHKNDEEIT